MTLSEYRHKFITLFQTWAMTHFSQVPDGGYLAATAMDIAMEISREKIEICKVMHHLPMAVVLELSRWMLSDGMGSKQPSFIDKPAMDRWQDACAICNYRPLVHLAKQRRAYESA